MRHRGGQAHQLIAAQRLERLDLGEEAGDLLEALALAAAVVAHVRTKTPDRGTLMASFPWLRTP